MKTKDFVSTNDIRTLFTKAMSEMYRREVPLYKKLLRLVESENKQITSKLSVQTSNNQNLLTLEHHGAIRVGNADELFNIRRLFKVMGMHPVDYYDLSIAGIPVHSTAFRALSNEELTQSPFRVFCSLLRMELIEDINLREHANKVLKTRQIFPEGLLKLIDIAENHGGLVQSEADSFIKNSLEVFRWHENATVDKNTYNQLKATHGLIADIISFKGPHINHLTPKVLDIDACQQQFSKQNIKAKAFVEGPPKRDCPILLRQTSFIAISENITFSNKESGTHTARFGEVEQRGIALTPKGRNLYDHLLLKAKNGNSEVSYTIRLNEAFMEFPDTYKEIRQQGLGYFKFSPNTSKTLTDKHKPIESKNIEELISQKLILTSPIVYEDFLPVSAAGIFSSNLETDLTDEGLETTLVSIENSNKTAFEKSLGESVINSFDLYEQLQQDSLNKTLLALGIG